jgi:methylated-DNA-[protein]-cysteine S-methyltransferase
VGFEYKWMDSPVGKLRLVASEKGLVAVFFFTSKRQSALEKDLTINNTNPFLVATERELNEYFAGERHEFSVPLDMRGTDFQKSVWDELRGIPFGETRSYGHIAQKLGKPAATRAVGAANGQNPIPIIVPCHRVIGSSGKLTGFGGGLHNKALLLELERKEKSLFVPC